MEDAGVIVCHYNSSLIQAATYALSAPILISGTLSLIGWMFGVFTLACYGGFLFTTNFLLLALQSGIHQEYPDPLCPGLIMAGPPNIIAYYTSSLATLMVCYYILLWKRPGAIRAFFGIFVFFLPPLITVWFFGFGFWDTFIMVVTGISFTVTFFWFMLMYIFPEMPYMFSNSVVGWFQYTDHMFLTKEQQLEAERDLLVRDLLLQRDEEEQRVKEQQKIKLAEWVGR